MIYILTRANKTASVKPFSPTVNSSNVISQPRLTDLLLDSGTTNNSICNKVLFMMGTYKKEASYLKTRSRERILSEGFGSVLVLLQNGNRCQTDFALTKVWYFYALQFNLISTRCLGKNGIETRLQAYGQLSELIYREKILGFADSIDQQYHIRTLREDKSQIFVTSNYVSDWYLIWHEHLGHLSYINKAKFLDLATGLRFSDTSPKDICGPCMKRCQQRNINRTKRPRVTRFLGIVHSDVGGTFPPTLYVEKYYSLLKNDSTGVSWIYLMKTKGEISAKFCLCRSWAKNQSGCKLRILRADGGGSIWVQNSKRS